MRLLLSLFTLLIVACGTEPPTLEVHLGPPARLESAYADVANVANDIKIALVAEVPEAAPTPEPYAGWKLRCEPEVALCRTNKDCDVVHHPAAKPLRCIKPWWSKQDEKGNWTKVCSPGWSNRAERQWRRDRLRRFVMFAYFDEIGNCIPDSRTLREQPWECQRERRKGNRLTKFLWTVYHRETTGRPWKRHRLNGDIRLARDAWMSSGDRYGHTEVKEVVQWRDRKGKLRKGKHTIALKFTNEGNPYYRQRWRWNYGLGPYGQNAAFWVAAWDPMAPPEILCGEVESTESYLRGARRSWRKLRGGIKCGDKLYRPQVTWEILHRAIAGGKLCPARSPSEGFRRRARKKGLDPDQVVTLAMLGRPIDRETQTQDATEYYSLINSALPAPGMREYMLSPWQQ